MHGPKPRVIVLSIEARHQVEQLVRRHSTPQQLVVRARIVLAAADDQSNVAIGHLLGVNENTVRKWRARWALLADVPLSEFSVRERLADAGRSGRPAVITGEQRAQIQALACAAPSEHGVPISQWSDTEIARAIVAAGILPTLSARHAGRLLKRGACSRIAPATG